MRIFLSAVAACSLCASAAFAQELPAQSGPSNPAVSSLHGNNSSQPVAGANSFTKDQAISAIEAKGYTQVARLTKDQSGVWRGMAMKDGRPSHVSLDYQGNVN
jgi:hypothetical protein